MNRYYIMLELLLHDLQDFHGAGLDTNAAGDALGNGVTFFMDHDLHGADLNALAAANAQLLIDHVHAGLGILGDGTVLTSLHALAALDADIGLGTAILAGNDLNAGIVRMELLIKGFGASLNALQAGHALYIFLNSELLHNREFSFMYCLTLTLYSTISKIATGKNKFSQKYQLFHG